MLKFFRTIRKKLIEQDNVRKYLLYAIGEILLVVIGILIALQVNNWNEQRKAENTSDITLHMLYAELEEAKSQVESSLEVNKMFLNWTENYLNSEAYIDTLKSKPGRIFRLISSASITLDMPVLQKELSSEQLINDQNDLSLKLRSIKNEYDEAISIKLSAKDLWNSNVIGYFLDKRMLVNFNAWMTAKDFDTDAVVALLYDEDYKNIVAMSNSINIQLVNIYERLLGHLEEALIHIETIN